MSCDAGSTRAYRFDLPEQLIAQEPVTPRDAARLFVLRHGKAEHRTFADLPEYLRAGDVLVLNETRVIAARIFGRRMRAPGEHAEEAGGRVELLLLRPALQARYDARATRWWALAKPARRLREGTRIAFAGEYSPHDALGYATVTGIKERGMRQLDFSLALPFERFLERAGRLPLPPYIHNDSMQAQQRYQTIFARVPGSVAAPTASLHFTQEVLQRIRARGVEIVSLVLDVGLGTFRPMQGARIDEHAMHGESYCIPPETARAIVRAKAQGRRIIAAGTTVVRALEGCAEKHGTVCAAQDETQLFIKPGFAFGVVDALITNFHLPCSTLLVLVSAFAGRETILRAYDCAIALRYRFFSFGDAMYIEPGGAKP